jgi:cysteine synthase A
LRRERVSFCGGDVKREFHRTGTHDASPWGGSDSDRSTPWLEAWPGLRRGSGSGEEAAQRITQERNAFRADQFHLASSSRAHYLHTAPEILKQAGVRIDAFCDYAGTGSSFAGCAAAFKEHDRSIQCYIVEPVEAAVLAGKPVTNPNHRIQGGGYSMEELSLIDKSHIDGYLQVRDEEAMEITRLLAKEEGIFAGFSSGANVFAAMQLLKTICKGKTIAVLLPDSGLKYLSTDLWL